MLEQKQEIDGSSQIDSLVQEWPFVTQTLDLIKKGSQEARLALIDSLWDDGFEFDWKKRIETLICLNKAEAEFELVMQILWQQAKKILEK